MNIDQLRYFLTVACARSISHAAAELHLSQPNLSIAIRSLEDELGYELLKRTNRGVELTEKGRHFAGRARALLLEFDGLSTLCDKDTMDGPPVLTIAAMAFCRGDEALAALCGDMQLPPRRIKYEEGMRSRVIEGVSNLEYGLGIIYVYQESRAHVVSHLSALRLRAEPLAPCEAAVVIGPGSPLFEKRPAVVEPNELRGMRRIFYAQQGRPSFFRTYLPELPFSENELLLNDRAAYASALAAMPSFSIVPCACAALDAGRSADGLHYARISWPRMAGEFMWIIPQGQTPCYAAERYLAHLKRILSLPAAATP